MTLKAQFGAGHTKKPPTIRLKSTPED